VDAEELDGNGGPERALSAYFTMVRMGKNGRPQEIGKPYTPETEDEKRLYEIALAKKQKLKK